MSFVLVDTTLFFGGISVYSPMDLNDNHHRDDIDLTGNEQILKQAGVERPWMNGNVVLRTADAIVALGLRLKSWYINNPQNYIPNIHME